MLGPIIIMMNEKVKHWNKFDQLCTLCNVHGSSSYQKNEKARKKRNKTNTDYKQNRMLHLSFKINSIRNDWPMNFISLGIGLNRRCRLNDAKSFGQVLIDIAPFWTIQSFSTHSHKSYRYSFRMKNSFRILFFWGVFFFHCFSFSTHTNADFYLWLLLLSSSSTIRFFLFSSSLQIKIYQTIEVRIPNVFFIRSACAVHVKGRMYIRNMSMRLAAFFIMFVLFYSLFFCLSLCLSIHIYEWCQISSQCKFKFQP